MWLLLSTPAFWLRDSTNNDALVAIRRLSEESSVTLESYNKAIDSALDLSDEDRQLIMAVNSPAVVLNDQRDVKVEDNGDLTIDTKRSIFIKDATAIKAFTSTEIPYDLNSMPKVLRHWSLLPTDRRSSSTRTSGFIETPT